MNETPLNAWHKAHQACMTDFNGWEMPLYYHGIAQEHLHTRRAAGLFDLCHMGRIFIAGPNAGAFVDRVTPAGVEKASPGDVLYSFLLNTEGCPIDDITVYVDSEWMMLVVNAGNRERVLRWLNDQAHGWSDVYIEDRSESWGMIAIQGPQSDVIMNRLLSGAFEPLDYYTFRTIEAAKLPYDLIVSATGYTGEKGYEMYLAAEHLVGFWSLLFAAGTEYDEELWPIGLGARDSLRLEAGMPLYGHELDESVTPLEAGLGRFIDLEKGDFIGRDALLRQKESGVARKLIGFEMMQRGPVPRHGHEIHSPDDVRIGQVTSGIFSPTLQKSIGMGYVESPHVRVGSQILIDVRGRKQPAQVVKKPFYKRST